MMNLNGKLLGGSAITAKSYSVFLHHQLSEQNFSSESNSEHVTVGFVRFGIPYHAADARIVAFLIQSNKSAPISQNFDAITNSACYRAEACDLKQALLAMLQNDERAFEEVMSVARELYNSGVRLDADFCVSADEVSNFMTIFDNMKPNQNGKTRLLSQRAAVRSIGYDG